MRQEETRPSLGREALASIVVFLVALPLCMGISLASGVSPALGLISGIIGGIVVGLLAGSPLQVSGPAAGLAVIVWELIQTHGIELLGPIVLTAGLIQLAAGLSGLGRYFRAIAPPVVYSMLAGIGVLITALDRITPGSDLHVHVQQLSHIDHACLDALAAWEKQGERQGSKMRVEWEELVGLYKRAGRTAGVGAAGAETLDAASGAEPLSDAAPVEGVVALSADVYGAAEEPPPGREDAAQRRP